MITIAPHISGPARRSDGPSDVLSDKNKLGPLVYEWDPVTQPIWEGVSQTIIFVTLFVSYYSPRWMRSFMSRGAPSQWLWWCSTRFYKSPWKMVLSQSVKVEIATTLPRGGLLGFCTEINT
jgi:hypothetical protein